MKYYRMDRMVKDDSTLIYQVSHETTELKTGMPLVDYEKSEEGERFKGPLICVLDEDTIGGKLPTFYKNPAVISTKQFYEDLLEMGVTNFETFQVKILDEVNRSEIDDYILLNILGSVSCADMNLSEYSDLGDDIFIIDDLVLDKERIKSLDFFLVKEDTDCIIVSEKIYKRLKAKGYDDIHFEELSTN
jgi:hypothetical protein